MNLPIGPPNASRVLIRSAIASSEGKRTIRSSDGSADASYEVGQLPDGRWAIHYNCN